MQRKTFFLNLIFAILTCVTHAQKIGINTNQPQTDLHLRTREVVQGGFRIEGSDSTRVISLNLQNRMAGGRNYVLKNISNVQDSLNGKLIIQDKTANRNRLVIDSVGRVGIGVLSPTAQLEVNGPISTDSTLFAKQVLSDILFVQDESILSGQLNGSNAFFSGGITAIQGNILGNFSAINANFISQVTSNQGDFNMITADEGLFNLGLSAKNIVVEENLTADSVILNHLVLNDDLELENGYFSGFVTVDSGLNVNQDLDVLGGRIFSTGKIETNEGFRHGNGQINTHHVSALDFDVQGPFTVDPWIRQNNYRYLFTAGPDSVVVLAPLNLPDSAIIRSMTVYYYDNSESELIFDSFVQLKVISKTGSVIPDTAASGMFSTTALVSNTEMISEDIGVPPNQVVIDNASNMYFLQVDWNLSGSSANKKIRFYGVSVEYQIFAERGI